MSEQVISNQRTNLTVESNVRTYFLACSKQNRANKFKRVSQERLDEVEAEVDCIIRQIESKIREPLHSLPPDDDLRLITGFAAERALARLEKAIRKIICNKTQSTPSCGITL
jgi:hypothetical protein